MEIKLKSSFLQYLKISLILNNHHNHHRIIQDNNNHKNKKKNIRPKKLIMKMLV